MSNPMATLKTARRALGLQRPSPRPKPPAAAAPQRLTLLDEARTSLAAATRDATAGAVPRAPIAGALPEDRLLRAATLGAEEAVRRVLDEERQRERRERRKLERAERAAALRPRQYREAEAMLDRHLEELQDTLRRHSLRVQSGETGSEIFYADRRKLERIHARERDALEERHQRELYS